MTPSLGTWVLLLLALAPLAVAAVWLALLRAEPFDPGPDGFWRARFRRTQYGLRVEPEAVRLHARAPRWMVLVGMTMAGCAWLTAWQEVLGPFADALPLPPAVVVAMRSQIDRKDLLIAAAILVIGIVDLVGSRRQTDLLLEAKGDLRWRGVGLEEGSVPIEAFEALTVERDGSVLLRAKERGPVRLFGLRGWRTEEHEADLRRATEAFQALIARRRAAGG